MDEESFLLADPALRLYAGSTSGDQPWLASCGPTPWTAVLAAASGGEAGRAALDLLYRIYWTPLFAYFLAKRRCSAVARELAGAFIAERLVCSADLKRVKPLPDKLFRHWLFTAAGSYLKNRWAYDHRQCRDVRKTVSLNDASNAFLADAAYLGDSQPNPERRLARKEVLDWLASVVGQVRDRHCKRSRLAQGEAERRFEVVKVFLPGPECEEMDYPSVAEALNMNSGAVKKLVAELKLDFRELLERQIQKRARTAAEVREFKRLLCEALMGRKPSDEER